MNDLRNYRAERRNRWEKHMEKHGAKGHIWTGVFLVLIGAVAMARSFGVAIPEWLLSWQMLLVVIGLYIGLRKGFRDGGWFVPIIIGGAFLVNDYFMQGDLRRHIWPMILIVLGVIFLFRAGQRRWQGPGEKKNGVAAPLEQGNPFDAEEEYTEDSFVSSTCIFSGAKKVILSKNFKGGDLVNIFGGCEIDLTQADMTAPAVIDVTAIFGGATLVVPSNWAIQSEAVTIFGGISDKRKIMPMADSPTKTLIIKGALVFGGMEIKSY